MERIRGAACLARNKRGRRESSPAAGATGPGDCAPTERFYEGELEENLEEKFQWKLHVKLPGAAKVEKKGGAEQDEP